MAEAKSQSASPLAASPETQSLIDQITQITVKPSDESYGKMRDAVGFFLAEMLKTEHQGAKVDKQAVDEMIAEYDRLLSRQVDAIMHNAKFQELESAWRGLKLLVDRTDFRENIKIEIMNVSKDALLEDFEDSPEIVRSGLYKQVYTAEYGTFGGEPYGAMLGNYHFGPGSRDVKLLQSVAAVATMAHAPFISGAGPEFFGLDSFEGLPNMNDLADNLKTPKHTKWQSFRESEDSRSVGLTVPRFLLRLPYSEDDNPIKGFNYNEDVSGTHEDYLWGNAAFAFATRLTDSFGKYRWCPNIIGPQAGGAVEDLPVHTFESMGQLQSKIPTEVLISERREVELAEEGFIALTMRKGSDNACFFSANSPQKPKNFGQSKEGKDAETNYKLGTQLPYMFVVNRLAHYIKVIQRESIGRGMSRTQLESELDKWIRQYVSDMDVVDDITRAKRPLRQAKVTVSDVEGDPGWYAVSMKVKPHMKYMGAFFELSLVGKLDKD